LISEGVWFEFEERQTGGAEREHEITSEIALSNSDGWLQVILLGFVANALFGSEVLLRAKTGTPYAHMNVAVRRDLPSHERRPTCQEFMWRAGLCVQISQLIAYFRETKTD
jgi:hypothetical protein